MDTLAATSLPAAWPLLEPGDDAGIEALLAHLDIEPGTRSSYSNALRSFTGWLGGRPVSRQEIIRYRDHLLAEGKSPGTVNQHLTALRATFSFLEAEGYCPNIARNVKRLRMATGFKREALTAEQARQVIDSIEGDDERALRDRAMLELMLRTGLRVREVALASIGDMEPHDSATVLWVQGKGHVEKDEYVVLTDTVVRALDAYLHLRGPLPVDAPLFAGLSNRSRSVHMDPRSIRRIATRVMKKAGVKTDRITAHSTRHTAATLALRGGADIRAVQKMMRHRSIKTTEIYAHDLERVDAGAERAIDF